MGNHFLKNFEGFSKLNYKDRLKRLQELGYLSKKDLEYLYLGSISNNLKERIELTQCFIENALGYFPLPLGLATNFIINKKAYILPMAVEETSIIAAASKTARWVCKEGTIKTQTLNTLSIGQIQIPKVKNYKKLKTDLKKNFRDWKEKINKSVLSYMKKRGGGLKDYELRLLKRPDGESMAILHLHIETCSAMGANIINQTCEYLKKPLEKASGEKAGLCILSNLADKRIVRAEVRLKNQDRKLIKKIEEASLFAEIDPYRACTNNKGVLNGIDALMIATGNDWRAVSAGLHAYSAQKGAYSSLTKWRAKGSELYGEMTGPFMLGTVGGVTDLHPTARLSLKILGYPKATELAGLACALGLVQNLGALKALVTVGVIEGHMRLHIKNLVLKAGAKTNKEQKALEKELIKILKKTKRITLSQANQIFKKLKQKN
ncbi:MAG: hydroxymethylglutaryl-CoA reductase, degradative [Bdellovibrionaceae bacterium]|nr:hydroxymethylglutaryl-CoA reductase, degradative [Pseudobdellovibrionaceae bacterium]